MNFFFFKIKESCPPQSYVNIENKKIEQEVRNGKIFQILFADFVMKIGVVEIL